jgi:ribosomal protein S18 acetylase RimI-like enzyme
MRKINLEPVDVGRDSEMLLRWFTQLHVVKWWGDAAQAMEHARRCLPASHALIVADGVRVGYLCWQEPPKEELEVAGLTDLPKALVDIDILIGEKNMLGQGIGTRALEKLLSRLRADGRVEFAGLGTSVSNANAIQCFLKAGFRPFREFKDPVWGQCKYLIAEVRSAA